MPKSNRINRWKSLGIRVENDDWESFYQIFLSITECQICKKELTIDKRTTHSTRCVDHDHAINDRPNVRAICCNACNVNDNSRNTSGEPNIYYNKRGDTWYFQKAIKKTTYTKSGFKTKQEAIDYKLNFLLKLRMEPPNEGEDQSI